MSNKRVLRINFTDFWEGFSIENNLLIRLLHNKFDVVISENPDVLFYSCYGYQFAKYNCHKIFYTAENIRPNFNECDFAFTFDYNDYGGKNFRLPLYVWYVHLEDLLFKRDLEAIFKEKTKFCCTVVSNRYGKERNRFFEELSKYKKVDSGGNYLNNIGYKVADKIKFIKNYKFTISFENSSFPGYTTEKIIEPMFVNSIPIYWGNPFVAKDFNSRSFINIHDFKNFDEAINKIIEIDNNEEQYKELLLESYFNGNSVPENLKLTSIQEKLYEVINTFQYSVPVSKTSKRYTVKASVLKKRLTSKILRRAYWHC